MKFRGRNAHPNRRHNPIVCPTILLYPVVRRFLGDDDVMHVAFAQAGRGDPQEARLLLPLLDVVSPAVSHAAAQPPPQWIGQTGQRPLGPTRPSMPSGTSLPPASCAYRSELPCDMAPIEPIPRYVLNVRPWKRMVSPGLSSVPASRLPILPQPAPAAIALVISPEYLIPPSAIRGTPPSRVARAHSLMARICGTPAPDTTRVVQMDPGPMPTLTPSTPSEISSLAPS